MNLPKRLVEARERNGLSQIDIAKKLDVSPGTVGGWETGAHGIRIERLPAVARAYGTTMAELLA